MVRIPTGPAPVQPTAPPDLPGLEIECPLTGEIVEPDDVDTLIDTYERLKLKNDQIYAVMLKIRLALAAQTEGDAVTRRVVGKRRRAKVTMSDEQFDQSVLKELWNSHEELARQYMKIASLSVAMREYRKLANTSSNQPDFVFFRDAMTRANRGRTGTPTIAVE